MRISHTANALKSNLVFLTSNFNFISFSFPLRECSVLCYNVIPIEGELTLSHLNCEFNFEDYQVDFEVELANLHFFMPFLHCFPPLYIFILLEYFSSVKIYLKNILLILSFVLFFLKIIHIIKLKYWRYVLCS